MFQLGEAETTAFDGLRKFVTDELCYPNHRPFGAGDYHVGIMASADRTDEAL
jgi:hypothetical protein